MNSFHLKLLAQLILGISLVLGIHFGICQVMSIQLNFPVVGLYSVLLIGTILVFEMSYWNHELLPNQINAGFLLGTFLKAGLVYFFIVKKADMSITSNKIHIIILYLSSLLIEVIILFRLLNTEKESARQ